jgi:hypothetical protein
VALDKNEGVVKAQNGPGISNTSTDKAVNAERVGRLRCGERSQGRLPAGSRRYKIRDGSGAAVRQGAGVGGEEMRMALGKIANREIGLPAAGRRSRGKAAGWKPGVRKKAAGARLGGGEPACRQAGSAPTKSKSARRRTLLDALGLGLVAD